ncbi:phosphatidylserine decarboxylase proenzyme 1, mitochondrial-like isoform X1 [Salvia splendens]|uniref:phosphatidylserine decarboxylase proenzyme 1, mitochondrial-like isoform X1 n=1 Tax=Salvia splendens TaxID=180675 RepID=UPI001C25E318|nr:phosphatidylserine decarboxylase proenzyme 1, mitochondrial-like isoform X1 [Salvia splendens]
MTKWRASRSIPLLNYNRICLHRRFHFTTFLCSARPAQPQASFRGGASNSSGSSQGNSFLVPGATVATILMLGALHVRRMYDDKQIEEAKAKGIESEFHPDVKARFLRLLPLRSISRFWGSLTGVELPIWLRPYVYKAWARAFHSNLEEAQLPLEEYASLREFFVRKLKESSRPIDSDPCCLVSPVDGTVLRFGELRGPGAMIEQVKGCSYSASSLLGANSHLPMIAAEDANEDSSKEEKTVRDVNQKSWWSISFLASPKVRDNASSRPQKGLFYCVIYLKPGDYHRIHSPVDWNLLLRRHFSGHLFPMNERATRTIRNLYVENERVVLEGQWKQGYMAMAAIGATNIGSIELFIEPTLKTNNPQEKLIHSLPPDERLYEPEGTGVPLRKGDEVAAFNMGSTVVLVFQAPISQSGIIKESSSDFRFCIKRGDRIRMGEPLGRWNQS